jgi:chromosomal replication initiation ATPase DnaA
MNNVSRQIPLDLSFRPSYGRDSLIIAPCNETAVAWIDRWPDWSGYPLLTLFGPPASGKHHLAHLWAQRAQAKFITIEEFCTKPLGDFVTHNSNIVLERADFLIGDAEQEEKIFHLYNRAQQETFFIFLTMQTHPGRLSYAHGGHLASRLQAAPHVEITAPDEQTLAAVMIKLCADQQLEITPEMVFYALDRMERSFLAVKELVEALDKQSLADKRKITLPFLRQVMMSFPGSSV